jgi:hypothetical protein
MSIAEVLLIGVFATAATDVWQQALAASVGLPATDWRKVGRWVAWLPRGVLVHRPIAATLAVRGEAAIGWTFHYAIGIAYAALFLAALRDIPFGVSSLVPALVFAAITLAAPWLVLQPGLGLGVLARRTPKPATARFTTITTHGTFGIGLALGVDVWRLVVPA